MRSIKFIIFSWFLLNVGSVLVLLTLSLYFLSERLVENFVLQDHIRIVDHLSTNIQAQIKEKLRALDVVAKDYEEGNQGLNGTKENLKNLFHFQRSFTAAHVYNVDGKFLFNVRRSDIPEYKAEQNIFEISYVDQEYFEAFKKSHQEKKPYMSKLYKTRRGFAYQTYFLPLVKNGKVDYVLSVAVSTQGGDLANVVHDLSMSNNNFISFYSKEAGFFNSFQLPESLKDDLLKQENLTEDAAPTTFEHVVDGVPYYLLARFLPDVNTWMVFGINPKTVNQKLNTIYKYLIIFIVFVALIGFLFAYQLGKRLAAPLDSIIAVLKQYHIGNFKAKVAYKSNDDFMFLAQLINKLGNKLEKDQVLGLYWSNEEELRKIKAGEKIE